MLAPDGFYSDDWHMNCCSSAAVSEVSVPFELPEKANHSKEWDAKPMT